MIVTHFKTLQILLCVIVLPAKPAKLIDGEIFSRTLKHIANEGLGVSSMQVHYDKQKYYSQLPNGTHLILELVDSLYDTFSGRIKALKRLRDVTEAEISKFSTIAQAPKCCKTGGHVYNSRFRTNVSLHEGCNILSIDSSTNVRYPPSSIYDQMKENFRYNPHLKWQYVGLETGLLSAYPSTYQSDCHSLDPRYRPWYVETATSEPKHVVIVLDTSGSMETGNRYVGKTLMDIAKDAANSVLATLNPNDRVGVVAFSNTAHTLNYGCYTDSLALATERNKKALKGFINSLVGHGESNYVPAILKAFMLLQKINASARTDQVILFLTDGKPTDNHVLDHIRNQNSQMSNRVTIMTYGIGSQLDESAKIILTDIANQVRSDTTRGAMKGKFTWIPNPVNLRHIMTSYYQHFSRKTDHVIFTVPYVDAWGLGLVTSMCLPLYINSSMKLFGVTCIDITLSDLISNVTYFHQNDHSYAFIADNTGRVLLHPLLPTPFQYEDHPIFVDIITLERSSGAASVLSAMKKREMGQKTFQTTFITERGHPFREGIDTKPMIATYHYHPIPDTPFSLCIVIPNGEPRLLMNAPAPAMSNSPSFLYHRLDLIRAGRTDKNFCNSFGQISSEDLSTVKFAPGAFIDPYNYLDSNETLYNVTALTDFLTTSSADNPGLKNRIKHDVWLTQKADEIWKQRVSLKLYTLWRYIATPSGVVRLYPGSIMPQTFDASTRPWYKRSIAYPGKLVVSAAYLDAITGGYVVTLSSTLSKGGSGNQQKNNVAAVMGMDFTVGYFYNLIVSGFEECTEQRKTCFLVDASGNIIVHPSFFELNAVHSSVENVHISEKEPEISSDLINKKVMNQYGCINFETIKIQHFWKVSIPETYPSGIIDTTGVYGLATQYKMVQVPNSNVFLVMKHQVRTEDQPTKCHCPLNVTNDPEEFMCSSGSGLRSRSGRCECPCYSPASYQDCSNKFPILSDSWPTCAPEHKTLSVSPKVTSEDIKSLPDCNNPKCYNKKTKQSCFGVVGCQWCSMDKAGSFLEKAHCNSPKYCPFGKTLYLKVHLGNNVTAAVAGSVVSGTLFLIILGITVVIGIRKRRQINKQLNSRLQIEYNSPQNISRQSDPEVFYDNRENIDRMGSSRNRGLSETNLMHHNVPDVAFHTAENYGIDDEDTEPPPSYSNVMGITSRDVNALY